MEYIMQVSRDIPVGTVLFLRIVPLEPDSNSTPMPEITIINTTVCWKTP